MKRITISLDEQLYRTVKAHGQSEGLSLSKAVVDLMERALKGGKTNCLEEKPGKYERRDQRTGLTVSSFGRTITSAEVKEAMEDDDRRHLKHFSPQG